MISLVDWSYSWMKKRLDKEVHNRSVGGWYQRHQLPNGLANSIFVGRHSIWTMYTVWNALKPVFCKIHEKKIFEEGSAMYQHLGDTDKRSFVSPVFIGKTPMWRIINMTSWNCYRFVAAILFLLLPKARKGKKWRKYSPPTAQQP